MCVRFLGVFFWLFLFGLFELDFCFFAIIQFHPYLFRRAVRAWLERRIFDTDISDRTFIQIFLKQWIGESDCCHIF